ncbi:hypothetical protein CLV59_104200 [Chitinophaga dinghuensis]|uniref:Uncharacterized protein n=1 Tax=Chitinophaga dinghuensis TaxID=1539050 RepID=A0A327W159_9BACT|nr:hypothetical protein CLV59_104200 [Chitinophaga dinghuensis]
MKTSKTLLICLGFVSTTAGALASKLRHAQIIYVNDEVRHCVLIIHTLTTSPNSQSVTVTYASTQATLISCPNLLTLYKGL